MSHLKEFGLHLLIVCSLLSLTFCESKHAYLPGQCMQCVHLSAYIKKAMLSYQAITQLHVVTAQEIGSLCCAILVNSTFYNAPELRRTEHAYNSIRVHPICERPQSLISHSKLAFVFNNTTVEINGPIAAEYEFAFAILNNFTCT